LASDGGLFLPESLPDISGKLAAWASLSYAELAAEFFQVFAPEISKEEWHALTKKAYARFDSPDVAPLKKITAKTTKTPAMKPMMAPPAVAAAQ
jgi:threonine synthase